MCWMYDSENINIKFTTRFDHYCDLRQVSVDDTSTMMIAKHTIRNLNVRMRRERNWHEIIQSLYVE